ncbi:MAG: hypothetical protein U5L03_08030 [Burkholderiaceae bacterium]|nr:hypothetical protein [Burkholderiaceae bacterium]
MKPKWNVQCVAALLAVSTGLVLLAAVDFLAQCEVNTRDALARQGATVSAPVLAELSAGQPA